MTTSFVPDRILVKGKVPNPAFQPAGKGEEREIPLSALGNQLVDLAMPRFAALSALGRLFVVDSGTGTAQAPATAQLVTTIKWGIYNNNAVDSGNIVMPIRIMAYLRSGTMGLGLSLMAAAETAGRSAPGVYSNSIAPTSTIGRTNFSSNAQLCSNLTSFATSAFMPLASRSSGADTAIGSGVIGEPEGILIARPGYAIGFDVLASTGTSALFGVSVLYYEGPYPLAA